MNAPVPEPNLTQPESVPIIYVIYIMITIYYIDRYKFIVDRLIVLFT